MTNQGNSDHEGDGVDRRGFLKCMAWAGTGLIWSVGGGILSSRVFGQGAGRAGAGSFSFVQISDSHIGFGKDPYKKSVTVTLQEAALLVSVLFSAKKELTPIIPAIKYGVLASGKLWKGALDYLQSHPFCKKETLGS